MGDETVNTYLVVYQFTKNDGIQGLGNIFWDTQTLLSYEITNLEKHLCETKDFQFCVITNICKLSDY